MSSTSSPRTNTNLGFGDHREVDQMQRPSKSMPRNLRLRFKGEPSSVRPLLGDPRAQCNPPSHSSPSPGFSSSSAVKCLEV